MIPYSQHVLDMFQWLVRSSFHATILLCLILIIRAVLQRKFRFRMVYWLWMLLLLRLVWPLNIQTTFSVFNVLPRQADPGQYLSTPAAEERAELPVSPPATTVSSEASSQQANENEPVAAASSPPIQAIPEPSLTVETIAASTATQAAPLGWRAVLSTIWLIGVVMMGGYVLFCHVRLWRIITSRRLVTQQPILDLLEDCKGQLGLQTVIGVVETDKIKTPCLFGYLRPRLLLPTGALNELTTDQLRYVFIHELAHLKRHDIFIGWLMAAVQVLHWFNPAVWFAMTQINADRELACDELVLSTLAEHEPQAYGSTILTFLERFSRQQKLPAMAGIAENQSLLRRRLTMISTFKNKKVSFIPAVVVLLLLGATTFTSARNLSEIGDAISLRTDRGKVAVVQMPLSENDYTLIIRFDDNSYGAAGWYDVNINIIGEISGVQQVFPVHVKAYIDGISDLVFKDNRVYWHNRDWAVPGKHDENNYPTTINDVQWHPNWPEETRNLLEPRGDQKSDTLTLPFELPQSVVGVVLNMATEGVASSSYTKPEWVYVDDEQGPSGYALKFDGESNYVRVPNNPTLEPKEEMTIEMWAYIDGPQTTYTRLLRKTGHGASGYMLAADQNDRRMQVRFDFNNVNMVIRAADPAQHTDYDRTWHHFAGVYAKDYVAFYVDGQLVERRSHEARELMHSPVDLYIGYGAPGGPSEHFKGMIDEVRIWNTARTDQQISENMNRLVPTNVPGLAAYWKFDEGSGDIAHDSTSNQNHGQFESSFPTRFRSSDTTAKTIEKSTTATRLNLTVNPDSLSGKLIFQGRYRHRNRGVDIDTPSELWLKQEDNGKLIVLASLPWMGSFDFAEGVGGQLTEYRVIGNASNNRPAYYINLEIRDGEVMLTRQGVREDCENKPLAIPDGAYFNPNSRPDSYCADNIFLRGLNLATGQMKEFQAYDWDNTGELLVGYSIQITNAGKEQITVPAGTFNANHFILKQVTSADTWFKKRAGHITDYWVLDNHIIVRIMRHREPYEMELLDYTFPNELSGMQQQKKNETNELQKMIDAATSSVVRIPAGVYEKPIKITKSIQLIGDEDGGSVIKVTANEPAILIDTAGKGQVALDNLTIQWQLATSDQHEMPFAVAIKDTRVGIGNCTFRPLGDPQRSPVAIRGFGFTNMNVYNCDFEGFDSVVCYGEGTKGRTNGCFIRNCGHQGVILYSGAEATVDGNIITGSGYHAVRTTGGTLFMRDNLIINNENRGVYLGNKSGSGVIQNNLIIGNGTGVEAISACQFEVVNNVIMKSPNSAITARPYAELKVVGNVFADNARGVIVHQEEGQSEPIKSYFDKNIFWNNKTDMENCEGWEATVQEPDFIEPENGNFTLADPSFKGIGLRDPKVIFDLWQKYKEYKNQQEEM